MACFIDLSKTPASRDSDSGMNGEALGLGRQLLPPAGERGGVIFQRGGDARARAALAGQKRAERLLVPFSQPGDHSAFTSSL